MNADTPVTLVARIQNYLGNGGVFNPEMMDHDKVRELIIDCRDVLSRATPPSETSDAPAALRERILEIALRNRDACGYNCDCHDEIAALFASLPAPPRTQP